MPGISPGRFANIFKSRFRVSELNPNKPNQTKPAQPAVTDLFGEGSKGGYIGISFLICCHYLVSKFKQHIAKDETHSLYLGGIWRASSIYMLSTGGGGSICRFLTGRPHNPGRGRVNLQVSHRSTGLFLQAEGAARTAPPATGGGHRGTDVPPGG